MSDIELVIKIPEGLKKDFESEQWTALSCMEMKDALMNGTPLPKQHGDLIDKDKLLDELEKTVKSVDDTNKHFLSWDRAVAHVHLSKPIIEADGGSEDGNSD